MNDTVDGLSSGAAALLFAAFAIVTLAIATAALFVFAELTGWRALARRFPCPPALGHPRAAPGAVLLGAFAWNGPPLRIGLDDVAGVTLRPIRPFAIAFPAVCVPWSAIRSVEQREYRFFTVLEVRYGPDRATTIGFLPSAAATAISERMGSVPFVGSSE
jgi:hypothetical protein